MRQNDEKLVKDYLEGNELAFEQLLKKYLKPIYNFLYRLTGNAAQAEDLTQVAFVKVWKNIRKFNPQKSHFTALRDRQNKSFKAWLFTIAKNTAFDWLKKRKSIPFSYFENEEGNNKLEEIAEDSILPSEIMERKDLAKELETKLKQIPEKYGIILELRYKEDFTLGEIAEILGKPYNTIKVYHQRALISLKKAFLEKSRTSSDCIRNNK